MNAQRKAVLVRILEGMKSNIEEYSFEQALADIYEYYQAGTFMGAVTTIQADSGAKEKEADVKLESLTIVTPVPPELQARREKMADYVKKLEPIQRDTLAKSLGLQTGETATIEILTKISGAQSVKALDLIAQKIKILFEREF